MLRAEAVFTHRRSAQAALLKVLEKTISSYERGTSASSRGAGGRRFRTRRPSGGASQSKSRACKARLLFYAQQFGEPRIQDDAPRRRFFSAPGCANRRARGTKPGQAVELADITRRCHGRFKGRQSPMAIRSACICATAGSFPAGPRTASSGCARAAGEAAIHTMFGAFARKSVRRAARADTKEPRYQRQERSMARCGR